MTELLDHDHLDLPLLTEQVHDAELPELSEPRVIAPAFEPVDIPSLHEVVVLPATDAPPILTDIVEPASLPTVDAQSLPNLLKAAGDGFRLEILRVLAQDSFGVLELCRIFNAKQSGMSHHLKVLTSAGLLSTRREGNSIFYRRSYLVPDSPLASLQQALFASIDQLPITESVQTQLRELEQERSLASQQFFAENAHKFREQQDLIASYPVYAEHMTQLLNNTPLKNWTLALEVGPGEGEFLPVLAQKFSQVVALDSSAEMLQKSKEFSQKQNLRSMEFIHGDTHVLAEKKVLADCIVVNMVLHHTHSPADIFQDLSKALAPGGALLICDLCRHEQAWAKEACGDLWQGFEPQDFSRWATAANLNEGQSVYFALRNGFQIQLRQFFKPANF
ncbi:ArsR family transcriptional regulator [Cellvibrio zantedeschiae]|uniref:ArsR family transcriptional regulator n=1 Tax=Cellvibrio zantedeschiae TaxID=1237077 RepID=A0ABQ3B8T6_9GAMM|nr:metalloregulator ArsR/SmtB family transcription factor [Cellvibrio zantedeschiae]GGY85181.1 ArsR family transcriptional regulator [Cellvibrio zantedeschiae]